MSNINDEFILSYKMSFYILNFFVEIKNNNLNFNMFIKNYEIISHKFSQNVYKKFSNIGNFSYSYNINEYIINIY